MTKEPKIPAPIATKSSPKGAAGGTAPKAPMAKTGMCKACGCTCGAKKMAKNLPSMTGFQSLASNPTAKPTAGVGAKPAAPAPIKLPGKGPADHVMDAARANKQMQGFQSLAPKKVVKLPGAHLGPVKPKAAPAAAPKTGAGTFQDA